MPEISGEKSAPVAPEIAKYSEMLAQDPKSRVFALLAEALRKNGDFAEAVRTAQEGLKVHPYYLSGRMALARAYFDGGQLDAAAGEFERVVSGAPDNLLAHRHLAETYTRMGELAKAAKSLRMVMLLDPKDADAKEKLNIIAGSEAPKPPPGRPAHEDSLIERHRHDEIPVPPVSQAAPTPSADQAFQEMIERATPAGEKTAPQAPGSHGVVVPDEAVGGFSTIREVPGLAPMELPTESQPPTRVESPPVAETGFMAPGTEADFESFYQEEPSLAETPAASVSPPAVPPAGEIELPLVAEAQAAGLVVPTAPQGTFPPPLSSPVEESAAPAAAESTPVEVPPPLPPPARAGSFDRTPEAPLQPTIDGETREDSLPFDRFPWETDTAEPVGAAAAEVRQDELDTETLAEIHIRQGFYDKALAIYDTLLEKRPEHQALRQKAEELRSLIQATSRERTAAGGGRAAAVGEETRPVSPVAASQETINTLRQWLDRIGREKKP